MGKQQDRGVSAEADRATAVEPQSVSPLRDGIADAVADFRHRARICRTNPDAFDTKAASIWDLAADALEARYA